MGVRHEGKISCSAVTVKIEIEQILWPGLCNVRREQTEYQKTFNDLLLQVAGPALIMAMIASVIFFLALVVYEGQFTFRIYWVFGLFIFAAVLISRISIEEGLERAFVYGVFLGLATWFVACFFLRLPAPFAPLSFIANGLFIAAIWFCASRLTWDCTVNDSSRDVSATGLVELFRRKVKKGRDLVTASDDSNEAGSANEDSGAAEASPMISVQDSATERAEADTTNQTWDKRVLNIWPFKRNKKNSPGMWILYFSLIALPIFGIGQVFVPVEQVSNRRYAFFMFVLYIAAALGLLMMTSLMSLQRYLKVRRTAMPDSIAKTWMIFGTILSLMILGFVWLLPRPAPEHSLTQWLPKISTPDRMTSQWGWGNESNKNDENATRTESDDKAEKTQSKQNAKNEGGKAKSEKKSDGGEKSKSKKGKNSGGSKGEKKGKSGKKSDSKGDKSESKGDKSNSKGDKSKSGKSDKEKSGKESDKKGAKGESQKSDSEKKPSKTSLAGKESKWDKKKNQENRSNSSSGKQNKTQSKRNQNSKPPEVKNPPPKPSTPNNQDLGLIANFIKWISIAILIIAILVCVFIYRKEIIAGIKGFIQSLREFFANLFGEKKKKQAVELDDEGKEIVPVKPFHAYPNPFTTGNARKMTSEQLILHTFQAMQAWGRMYQCPRNVDQTPSEYTRKLARVQNALPRQSLEQFSDLVGQQLYSPVEIERSQLNLLQQVWETMERHVPAPVPVESQLATT